MKRTTLVSLVLCLAMCFSGFSQTGFSEDFETVSGEDVGVSEITMSNFAMLSSGAQTITGVISNYGGDMITSVYVSWNIDGGTTSTETITGLSIPGLGSSNFTLSGTWTPTDTGSHVLEVSTSNPNGNPDADPSNDVSSTTIAIVTQFVTRLPLYENFTSSTCPPCVPANATMLGLFGNDPSTGPNVDKWSLVKYQMSWPGNGDPYYTSEGNSRRNYYNINSVPRVEIDGEWDLNGNDLTQSVIDQYAVRPSFLDVSATYSLSGQTISVDVTILPLDDRTGFQSTELKLHMAIVENETYQNIGTNGEIEFQFVMKKMVPNTNGTSVGPFIVGTPVTVSNSYTFNGSYTLPPDANSPANLNVEHTVEEFDDLSVVVWVQDRITKAVFQSAWAVYTCGTAAATSVDAACISPDGSATASTTGSGNAYLWDDPAAQTTATATGLWAGVYTCVITDDMGCTVSATVAVNNTGGPAVTIQAIANACSDGATGVINLTVSGGTSPYTYAWSNGANTEDITGLAVGDYTVSITDDAWCKTFKTVSITGPDPITATATITNSTASDGAISLSVTGGTPNYIYAWDNGANTSDISDLDPGTYTVTITDGFGCTATSSYTVTGSVGIGAIDVDMDISIYPNPFNGSTTVEFILANQERVSLDVFSVVGELVYSEERGNLGSGSHKVQISGESLAPGIYFVRIQIGEKSITRKVIHN